MPPYSQADQAPAVGILGTGSYLPERTVPNEEIAPAAGVVPEWIENRTGIVARRRAAPHQATSDLAALAATRALAAAGLPADRIDVIVLATSTPDHPQPATASIVQHLIGAGQAAAVDVNAVCSGFVYALAMAEGLLRVRGGGHALVIGADVYSRILDYSDRRTAVLFGDGAGAVVLGPVAADRGLLHTVLRGHGDEHRLISVPAGGSRTPPSESTVREGGHFFRMDGRGVREFVSAELPQAIAELLRENGLSPEQIDHFVPHQANGEMLRSLLPSLGLPESALRLTVREFANTGSASVPITLDAVFASGELRPGQLVLLAGFGGGMNVGLTLLRWGVDAPAPVLSSGRSGQEQHVLTV
ncbi:3-oxoacyl-ACP synthase III family protein [Kitasatospora fiedleri]|uniref:3-oxoacyl-ACP synthase III family protein n=1 Tax=Kitasatospora fiedleri TaxID=2991545 RepID=UPI000C2CE0EF|nr:ketoacyl-ACP synthase III [Kitasatospora fiedleri]